MKTNNYRKRLDRIRNGLCLPIDGNATMMFHTMFGVPNLDMAISRARKVRATSVMFVPANGGNVQFVSCDQPENVPLGIAVAYEIAESAGADSDKPFEHLTTKQLDQIIKDIEVPLAAIAGSKESLTVVCCGKLRGTFVLPPKEIL